MFQLCAGKENGNLVFHSRPWEIILKNGVKSFCPKSFLPACLMTFKTGKFSET